MNKQNLPPHIDHMESILDNAVQRIDELEKLIEEFKALQPKIQELESYYTSPRGKRTMRRMKQVSSPPV